ncbi:PREDICTED: DNA (cytosine-5)-methyltransferase CMT3-like [Populus euphratica]|uniref:DNA (Cytosine-5)-methyltransferase CMT3-like n=1 Tax=Populus euphratica TaxID=75702 RepID=A0AAJ6UA14_POPEU|nr:PREDICTED: DNA (cytosine-5)-methyltransferase CMT3-like [Populus euphratica]
MGRKFWFGGGLLVWYGLDRPLKSLPNSSDPRPAPHLHSNFKPRPLPFSFSSTTVPRKRHRSTTTKPEAAASTSSSIKQKKTAATPKRIWLREVEKEEEEEVFVLEGDEDDTNSVDEVGDRMGTGNADSRPDTKEKRGSGKAEKKISTPMKVKEDETLARFVGAQIPGAEARKKWPHRYANKVTFSRCHYTRADVDRIIYDLYYDAYVQASDGEPDYLCRISEMFESVDRTLYFTTQWYYRSPDTIIKNKYISDPKCVFFSEIRNANPLECLTWKLNIVRLALDVDPENKRARSSGCDFYCVMLYFLLYSTFVKLPTENNTTGPESSTISNDIHDAGVKSESDEVCGTSGSSKSEVALLDLYSGCGAMSTGLCLGLTLVTVKIWAVDLNMNACQSLRLNHPETQVVHFVFNFYSFFCHVILFNTLNFNRVAFVDQVRNEAAEDFFVLLKEWEKLCIRFSLVKNDDPEKKQTYCFDMDDEDDSDDNDNDDEKGVSEVFEVEKILDICYGPQEELLT